MVQFKCIHTGNIVSFEADHDIKQMRSHAEYVEVTQVEEVKEEVKAPRKAKGQ